MIVPGLRLVPPKPLQVLEVWKSWSELLQLKENDDKSQLHHKGISGR